MSDFRESIGTQVVTIEKFTQFAHPGQFREGGYGSYGGCSFTKQVFVGPMNVEALNLMGSQGWILSNVDDDYVYFYRAV